MRELIPLVMFGAIAYLAYKGFASGGVLSGTPNPYAADPYLTGVHPPLSSNYILNPSGGTGITIPGLPVAGQPAANCVQSAMGFWCN